MNMERLAQACHLEVGRTFEKIIFYRHFLYENMYLKTPNSLWKDILVFVFRVLIPNLSAMSRMTILRLYLVSPRHSVLPLLPQNWSLVGTSITADMILRYNSSSTLLRPHEGL